MVREQLVRADAIQFLTMQRDLADGTTTKEEFIVVLQETGDRIGYAPAFRCLVKGLEPEESVRWGK